MIIVWRGQVKKIIPNFMILGNPGVNWDDLGTFWNDFRSRITVCNYMVEPSIENHNRVFTWYLLPCYTPVTPCYRVGTPPFTPFYVIVTPC